MTSRFFATAAFAVAAVTFSPAVQAEIPNEAAVMAPNAVSVVTPNGANADTPVLNAFGTSDEDISTVGWNSFIPYTSAATYNSDFTAGGRWNTAGSSLLIAPFPEEIPNGADITQIVFYARDTNATNDFQGLLCRTYTESNTGATPAGDCPFSASMTGAPGDSVAFGDPNVTLQRREDITGNGSFEVISWNLRSNQVLALDGTIRINQVRVLWRRQVSPAPATASFTDVPLGHPQRQFVEALAAAGITGGCGGSNFCPDAPLTRGQMAVFLSVALGLHWSF